MVGRKKNASRFGSFSRLPAAPGGFQSHLPDTGLSSTNSQQKHLRQAPHHHVEVSQPTIIMAANALALPDGLHSLLTRVHLEDITKAITNVTLSDFTHLINTARGRELNAEIVTKLYAEASKLPGAGSALMAATFVIFVVIFCFPMAAAAPLLTALGFKNASLAADMFVCKS